MTNYLTTITLAAGLAALSGSTASAHAFLERAVPGVGSTVTSAPGELELSFTQAVEVALSSVKLAAAAGGTVAVGKPTGDASNANVLHVRLGRRLAPGSYIVTWHVVAVDTHPTSGSYKFTVAP